MQAVPRAFDQVIDGVFEGAQPTDRVKAWINHPALDTPIQTDFVTRAELTGDRLMHMIEAVQQSKRDLALDEEMSIDFTHVRLPQGIYCVGGVCGTYIYK